MVDLLSFVVSTLIGSAGSCASTNGIGGAAFFLPTYGLALDADETTLYVAESYRIRGITLETLEAFTIAGSGIAGSTNDKGLSASFNEIRAIATSPNGRFLYVADATNNQIRKVELSSVEMPPLNLAYSTLASYPRNVPIASVSPSVSGGLVASYTISPALPSGLLIDASTGVLSGTPVVVLPSTQFTVTASNAGGSALALFTFQVYGPHPSLSFNCFLNSACDLKVGGVDISTNSRIKILPSSVQCGSITSVKWAAGVPYYTGSALVFTVAISQRGTHRICWWIGSGIDTMSSYTFDVGLVTVYGPNSGQSFQAQAHISFALSVQGTQLSSSNRIEIIGRFDTCGNSPRHSDVSNIPNSSSAVTPEKVVFDGLVVDGLLSYKVCWWYGEGAGYMIPSAYDTEIGILTMFGPELSQTLVGDVDSKVTLTVVGTGLSNANRIQIIPQAGACGVNSQDSAVLSAPSAPVVSSMESLIFQDVRLQTKATYKLCYWSGVGAASYNLEFGLFVVQGPDLFQTYTAILSSSIQVVVAGDYSMNFANRIKIISATDGACGTADQNTAKVTGPVDGPSGNIATTTYTGIHVLAVGSFRVCWWNGVPIGASEALLDYGFDCGSLTVEGPFPSQMFAAVLNTRFSVSLNGTSLAQSNRLRVIHLGEACGSDASKVLSESETTSGAAEMMTFSGLLLGNVGTFKVCWCELSCVNASQFLSDVGHVIVGGPSLDHSFTFTVNKLDNVVLTGSSLATQNHISIVDNSSYCGSSNTTIAAVSPSPWSSMSVTGSAVSATFHAIRLDAVGIYRLCWWEGSIGSDEPSDYTTEVGQLIVEGPSTLQLFTFTINDLADLVLVGSGMSRANRIMIIPGSSLCGDGSNMSSSVTAQPAEPSGSSKAMTYKSVRVAALGAYKVCWCHSVECDLHSFATFVGSLLVQGPLPSHALSILMRTASALVVSGTGLTILNRLKIVSGHCGSSDTDTSVTVAPGTPSGSSIAMTFSGVTIVELGSFKLCWWSGSSGSGSVSSYLTEIGSLFVGGPDAGQTFELLLGVPGFLNVSGSLLNTSHVVSIIRSYEYCGTSDTGVLLAVVGGSYFSASNVMFGPVSLQQLGSFKVCWSAGEGTETLASYATWLGTLTVGGPNLQQEFSAQTSSASTLKVLGTALQMSNRLRIIDKTGSCGSAVESTAVSVGAGGPVGTETVMTYYTLSVSAMGMYKVCWCPASCTANTAFAMQIGELSVMNVLATRYVIVTSAEATADTPHVVVVQAKDGSGNVILGENRDVTLLSTGSVSGWGVVNIMNGQGSTFLESRNAGSSVTLTLSDTLLTGLDVTSSQTVGFMNTILHGFTGSTANAGSATTTILNNACSTAFGSDFRAVLMAEITGRLVQGLPSTNTAGGAGNYVLFGCSVESNCKSGGLRYCVKHGDAFPTTVAGFSKCWGTGEYVPCARGSLVVGVTTFIGQAGSSGLVNAVGTSARTTYPDGLQFTSDSTNMFFTDQHTIRKTVMVRKWCHCSLANLPQAIRTRLAALQLSIILQDWHCQLMAPHYTLQTLRTTRFDR
jgi:hypothetical protein